MAWYGVSIIDTLTVFPDIAVHSIDVGEVLQLKSDSTYKVTWKCNIPSEVDSSLIDASFDNKKTWTKIGKTGAGSLSFNWKIPVIRTDSVYIKIISYDKSGNKASAISASVYSIDVGPSTSICGYSYFHLPPSFTPVTLGNYLKINYILPKGVKEVRVSIFDLKGRCIEQVAQPSRKFRGKGSLQINKGINPGYYYIRFRALFNDAKKPIVMTKKLLQIN